MALAAAVAFLLKWTFDRNMITPAVRVIGGGLFGVILLILAQWLHSRARVVSQALAGAGLASLYAVAYAATSLYAFIPQPAGFGLTIAITALAIGLSLECASKE